MKNDNYRLQFITHYNERYSYEDSAKIALEGGCRWVQLRIKDGEEEFLEQMALRVQSMCREYGATFIIDDNVLLAKKIGADGVHLGKNDMPVAQARQILGEKFIIGGTVNTFEDILYHLKNGTPDYFGCGPFRFTSTKKNLAPVLGFEGYRDMVLKMREKGIEIPLVAIGGITKEDIPQLLECGVSEIALSGSIINAENPVREMADVIEILTNYKPF
ncbi:MAG: thiamine phosphate synthase [Bacteroidales bacterium]|nr:thiamine phosphate synthase [Bacteroidales bacterium]